MPLGHGNIPKVGRVHFRWTRDLPVGKKTNAYNRITSNGCLDKTDCSPAHALGTVRACLLRSAFLSSDTSFDVTLVSLSYYGA